MDKLRLAVTGAGLIGRTHIALIQRSAEATLSGIVDPAPSAAEVARGAGVPLHASLGNLLATDRPDGVILATPNRLHVAQALECIAAGVPALVEKPVTDSVQEGERLCAAAEGAGAKVLVGHHRLHSPLLEAACAVIEGGALGHLVAVEGSALFYKPDGYFDEAPWRRQPGGGPILINLTHEIGNLRAMCGEIVAVQALVSNAVRGFSVEDTVAINLGFASGALGTFLLSDTAASPRSWEQTSQENPSYASYPDEDCYVVVGTYGSLAVPTMRLRTYPRKEDRSWWKPFRTEVVPVRREDPLARQLAHFCAVIRGEATPRVTARDGLANLRVTEAIAAAARTGATIRLDQSMTNSTAPGTAGTRA
ncbi:MAG TPA: Gfo/Idh/MocA family oxidoreductase [Casimicrobiaceae bacterium]|nr:Gfo/Idh/MocA family oxidoreductase [Casimicrobiaceae bacterium]